MLFTGGLDPPVGCDKNTRPTLVPPGGIISADEHVIRGRSRLQARAHDIRVDIVLQGTGVVKRMKHNLNTLFLIGTINFGKPDVIADQHSAGKPLNLERGESMPAGIEF